MENVKVGFEVAKLAKEKEFEYYCDFLYNEKGEIELVGNYNYLDDDKYVSYSAPTQSLLQRWLREKYDIHISIRLNKKAYKSQIQCVPDNKKYNCEVFKGKKLKLLEGDYFKNYEEALEKGFLYALQLI